MKEIKTLAHQIRDELDVAEEYAGCAVKLKADQPTDASAYAEMARDELDHADKLHKMAMRAIDKTKKDGAAASPAMTAVWDWEHENLIDRTAKVKTMLGMV